MDIEKIIDEKLKIMEKVENDLNKHRDEAVLCLSAYIVLSSIWIILIALWQKLGEPIAKSKMTIGVEIIAFIMFLFIIKFISIKIKDFGINKDNLKATLIRAFIICFVVGGLLWTYKYFLMEDKTYDFSQITFNYIFTSLFQEFLSRGFMLGCMMKVYDNKYSKLLSLIFSSLAFAVLHLFYGFDFMMLAGGLSLILGILYYYDNNIWGVSIVHYVLGTIAFVLKIV